MLMDAPSQMVTLYPNRDHTLYFKNHKKPTLTVNKVDSITGSPIKGAKFEVWYGSNNTTTGELNSLGAYFSDANGQFKLELLRDGWYRVTELEPAAGFRVYLSKVFTFTPDFNGVIAADEIVTGGTGYKDYGILPPEVEAMPPDYSIYPQFKRAIGFLTRGCIRRCEYCIVPHKEGNIHPAATWEEIKRADSREIVFLDNNVLASDFGLEQIDRMSGKPVWIDFNQGLDARLITPAVAKMLARLHWIRFIRMSCDTSDMLPAVEQAAAYLR